MDKLLMTTQYPYSEMVRMTLRISVKCAANSVSSYLLGMVVTAWVAVDSGEGKGGRGGVVPHGFKTPQLKSLSGFTPQQSVCGKFIFMATKEAAQQ